MPSGADWWKKYQVPDVPTGESGDWKIERFSVSEIDLKLYNLRLAFNGQGRRMMEPGDYTRLMRGHEVIMSDTRAEIQDHRVVLDQMIGAKTVMIAGLGLGVILQAAIRSPTVRRIIVYEKSLDVINLVAPHWTKKARRAGKVLTILLWDIFEVKPEKWEQHDVVWFDIWDNISADNWQEMKPLKRRWRRHAAWMGCWCESECRHQATGRYS